MLQNDRQGDRDPAQLIGALPQVRTIDLGEKAPRVATAILAADADMDRVFWLLTRIAAPLFGVLFVAWLVLRYIPNDGVGVVEKLWSLSGSVPENQIMAAGGQGGGGPGNAGPGGRGPAGGAPGGPGGGRPGAKPNGK